MRTLLLVPVVLVAAGCGGAGHHRVAACTLTQGEGPSERTGEHALVLHLTGCTANGIPQVELDGARGEPLRFAYVQEGGVPGHTVTLDKYRCDVRAVDHARSVRLAFRDGTRAALTLPRGSIVDYCPSEAPSTVMRVYLGPVGPPPTWRGVLRDVYDGRFDRVWPCRTLRAAYAHLPLEGPIYSELPGQVRRAEARACGTAVHG